MAEPRVVLVTGASSGVGQATAHLFAQNGYTVFGTSRNPAEFETIGTIAMLPLDVRRDDSVNACVETVLSRAGRVDVLINNAGYELAGAMEETSLEEARAQFETNFFGVVRMTNAVLPSMRRQNGGHIVNVGSLAGRSPVPFMGFYSATKSALEGYTEGLRHEVKPFNIRVSLIEPAFLKTPMMHHRVLAANRVSEYDPWRQRAFAAIRRHEENGPGAELVARTMLDVVSASRPRLRYLVGKQATSVAMFRRFLPESMFESGARRTFALDRDR